MITEGRLLEQIGRVSGVDLAVLAVVRLRAGPASIPKPPAMTEMNERFIAWHMM